MKILRFGLAALAVFAAASCKPAAKPGVPDASGFVMPAAVADFEKSLDGLRKDGFKVAGGAQADVGAIVAALPKNLSVKFASQTFDAASGATVLTKVVAADTNFPDVSVNIEEVKLWGLDAAFATARLSGQRLADSGPLARRVELKGVSVPGIDKTMTKLMSGMITQLGASGDATGFKVNKYDVTLAHAVYDNVSLRPFVLKPVVFAPAAKEGKAGAPAAEESMLKDVLPALQTFAAYVNAVAYDAAVYDNLVVDSDIDSAGSRQTGKTAIATMAQRGVSGGDTAVYLVRGTKQDMSMSGGAMGEQPISFSGANDVYTAEGVRMAKVLGYLATGTIPPRTDTDLLSLGVFHFGPMHYTLGGKPAFDMKSASFDGTGFHWLIPTKLSGEIKEAVFHVDTLMETFGSRMGGSDPAAAATMKAQIDVLKKYGLGAPSIDGSGLWTWDPKGGGAKLESHYRVAGWDKLDIKLDGGFPTFDQVSAQIPETGSPSKVQQEALEKMFTSSTLLRALNLDLVDEGGAAKVFDLITEFMAADPSTPKGSVPTAKAMKDETINGLNTQASQMKTEIPLVAAVMEAAANFLSTGAAIHLSANPQPPISAGEFEKLSNGDKAAMDRLNVTVNGKKP